MFHGVHYCRRSRLRGHSLFSSLPPFAMIPGLAMQKRPWLRRAGAALLLLAAVSAGFSRSLRAGRVHEYLSARLAAAFGRPVEVGQFGFSMFKGLRLKAKYVTVGEDLRLGHEYFLRAARLSVGLRWRSVA